MDIASGLVSLKKESTKSRIDAAYFCNYSELVVGKVKGCLLSREIIISELRRESRSARELSRAKWKVNCDLEATLLTLKGINRCEEDEIYSGLIGFQTFHKGPK